MNLDALGGTRGDAFAVAGGQVVGDYGPAGNAQFRPFRWTSTGGMVDLGTLGGTTSVAYGVNKLGQVVGQAALPNNTASHAFLYDNGTLKDLNAS